MNLYQDSVLKPAKTVQKRLWQPESIAGGAVWVAALQDGLSDLFPYQDDPAWSAFCSQQAAKAITGGTANQASCNSVDTVLPEANLTIAITSEDVGGNPNQQNNTIVLLSTGGGVPGVNSGVLEFVGFNNTSHQMKVNQTSADKWLLQCIWLQYC